MRTAVGFSPQQSLLSGLRAKGTAGQAAKGQAMAAAANAEMGREQQNQQFGVQQMQQESQLRQQDAANKQRATGNRLQEGLQQDALGSRKKVFDMGLGYDYARLRKQQKMAWKQAAFNEAVRQF